MEERKFQVALNNVLRENLYLYDIFIVKYNSIGIEDTILAGRVIFKNRDGRPIPIKKVYFDESMYSDKNEREIATALYKETKKDMEIF